MSTFITEMYEIKNMKELSNVHTLVLADELCAGTEHNSATSIVASMIHLLKQNKASFLFSTHLHSLVDLPIIKKLVENNELSINHFSTNDFQKESESDSELFGKMLDTRVSFCRTLKSGPGSTLYGLEIAKTFDLGNEFMKTAYKVRNEMLNQSNHIFNTKSSRYNSNVFIDSCEKCGKSSTFNTFSESSTGVSTGVSANSLHTHHIIEQHTADPYGMVELTPDLKIHKNHPQNLMVLCETCHHDIHHK
jgi:DNA mismatch repair protein MutS